MTGVQTCALPISRQALTEFLKLNLRDNDAVLFKGSTVTELDEIMTEVK